MNTTKQQENLMISMTRSNNVMALMAKSKPSELKLFAAIGTFMNSLRKPTKEVKEQFYDDKELRQFKNDNLINITPEFVFNSGAIDNTNLSTKQANYRARQLTKSLVSKNIITKINSEIHKDLYLINPLYIYWGATFGDVYITYCEVTNTPINSEDPFLNKVYVEYYDGQKTYPANPLVYKEIEAMYDNSPDIKPEPKIVEGPTSYFSQYYYSKSNDQFNSPYHISYSYLKDQYDREQRGLDPHWLAPKVPYSLNLFG